MTAIWGVAIVLVGSCHLIHLTAGLPTDPMQPMLAGNATSLSQNTNDTDDDNSGADALVVIKQKISTGWLADFVVDQMVKQCDGSADPAIQFYQCIENTTQLPAVWAAMGLNATMMRLRTVDSFVFRDHNITERKNTFITMIQPAAADSSQNTGSSNDTLMDLFNVVGSQSDNLCMNVDGLLSCLNPYLSACFPDSDSSNMAINQMPVQQPMVGTVGSDDTAMNRQDTSLNATNVTMSGSSSTDDGSPDDSSDASGTTSSPNDDDDDDEDDDSDDDQVDQWFFQIPFLQKQSQIFPALQQLFSSICADHAQSLKGFIRSVPCLFQSVDQGSDLCTSCNNMPDMSDLSSDNGNNNNSTSDDDATARKQMDAPTCSALRDCMECQMDMVAQTCGQEVATSIQMIVQIYFNNLQCFPNSNGNDIRQPFNVAIL